MQQAPFGRTVVNKQSPQYRNLRVLISPYLCPGVLGFFADPAANVMMDVHTAGVTYVYEPGFGMVWEFDGANGNVKSQYWENPGMGTWPIGGGISICWWQVKKGEGGASLGRIIQHATEALIYTHAAGGITFGDRRFNTTVGSWDLAGVSPISNTPRHICITYDAIISGAGPQIYVNGLLVGSMSETAAPVGSPTLRGQGSRNIGNNDDSGVRGYDGRLWDYRTYDGVLGAAQVWQLYDPKTRFDLHKPSKALVVAAGVGGGAFPFSDDFTGTNFDPWDVAKWAVTSG